MARSELNVVTMDHDGLKQSLIQFLQSTEFGDFNYEGSAINTIVDLLTRNSAYTGFLANMIANESFIKSAQIRANVVDHAQKLSYVPRTSTASKLVCSIEVTPANLPVSDLFIVMDPGTSFLASVNGTTYTFTNRVPYTLQFNNTSGKYFAEAVELYQGQLVTNRFFHLTNQTHSIPNQSCDSSTIYMTVQDQLTNEFSEATTLDDLSPTSRIWMRGEDHLGRTTIQFGRNVFGVEPSTDSIIAIRYIATEAEHANGISSLVPAGSISGYSNISVTVTQPSYGGSDRDDIETVRYLAPKMYQMQDRALTSSDYIPLLKSRFPFIESGISWGGETNVPPVYGSVFLSLLSTNDGQITQSIKDEMIDFVSSRNVGSITPVIVDPVLIGIDLSIQFSYNSKLTTKTFNQLKTEVINVVEQYNSNIRGFDLYYNESELVSMIKDIVGVESVYIDKEVFDTLIVNRFPNAIYIFEFGNTIEQGSLYINDFIIDSSASSESIFDLSGNIIYRKIVSGVTTDEIIGEINYETGSVSFTANFIQDANEFKLYVRPVEDNYYVSQNKIIYINNVDVSLLEVRGR